MSVSKSLYTDPVMNMDEWDRTGLWHHERDGVDGFTKSKNVKSVIELHVSYRQSRHTMPMEELPEKLIQRELAYQLGNEIIKGGLASYYKHFDQQTFEDTIVAEITVCPPGTKMRHVEDEMFKVNGEYFTEDEIINAIKQTYPDRLI